MDSTGFHLPGGGECKKLSIGIFLVPVHGAEIGCIGEVLGDAKHEDGAWRPSELCCSWSTIGSVYGKSKEHEGDNE